MSFAPADIARMFSRLAPRYDRFNRWSSLGLDGLWRRSLAAGLAPGSDVLDVGCGTGDLSLLAQGRGCRTVGLDFSAGMLAEARRRSEAVSWVEGSADALPFPDGRFDAVVSAYVMRNLFRGGLLAGALKEAFRTLRPGGRAVFLDLTRPRNALLRAGHRVYLKTVMPLVGRLVCGADWPGSYLRTSIEELPPEEALRGLFAGAGFQDFKVEPLWGGVVSLFVGRKP